jgi:hypothetical protein
MLNKSLNQAPSSTLIKDETEHLLLCFCTFCSQLKGKKLSLQNIFILSSTGGKNKKHIKRAFNH